MGPNVIGYGSRGDQDIDTQYDHTRRGALGRASLVTLHTGWCFATVSLAVWGREPGCMEHGPEEVMEMSS